MHFVLSLLLYNFFLVFNAFSLSQEEEIEINYTKANINRKKFYQVPQDELIFTKFQSNEPNQIFEGPLKGHGFEEPFFNFIIQQIRQAGINVYVDYFTAAKTQFYKFNDKYEVCSSPQTTFREYKERLLMDKANNYKHGNKFRMNAIPRALFRPTGTFAILTPKLPLIQNYKFPGTNIYNIQSILDDEKLKTIQITQTGTRISDLIYTDNNFKDKIHLKYKYRIYEFVSSNAIQEILMLQGKRMDWLEITDTEHFYPHQLKISKEKITFGLEFAKKNPALLTIDDHFLGYFSCTGKDLSKIKKIMQIINASVKKARTNKNFWSKVLKNYAKDFNLPHLEINNFYFTKDLFKYKKEIDRGDFDV